MAAGRDSEKPRQEVAPDSVGYRARGRRAVSVFRSGLREGGGRPRASAVAAALRPSSFGPVPPGAGFARTLLAALALLFAAPTAAEAQTEITLVSNTGETVKNSRLVGRHSSGDKYSLAQRFTTGGHTSGYVLTSVVARLGTVSSSGNPRVSIYSSTSGGPGTSLYVLTNPRTINRGLRTFTAPANAQLDPGANYFVVFEQAGSGTSISHRYLMRDTNSNSETAESGWSIRDTLVFRSSDNGSWSTDTESLHIAVKGFPRPPNTAATGKPGIDGTPQVGQTLTATAGNMADDDNLPATTFPAGYSFQWVQVDGTTETEIGGATSQTYDPVAGDVGKTLKVKVTFTDGGGYEETLTSDETDAVVAAPPPPVIPTLESAEALFVNGALRYRFDLRLSEGVSIPYREMRDHAFSVTNGRMVEAIRVHKERRTENGRRRTYSNHWRMWVAPVDETKPVTVTLRGNRPCSERGALCAGSGARLDGSPALTLSTDTNPPDLGSLPSLLIADTSGTEDSANLVFDVSLSKAVSAAIAVDFRTVSGGTATANADYQEASYRILFPAGATVQPGSVALIEDTAADAGETVNVEITNARVITPRGTEFGPLSITRGQATGTIDAPASSTTPLSNVNMRIENTEGSEGGRWLRFTVKLSRALDEYVCYDFETLDTGTAAEGVDFAQRPKSTLWQPPRVTEWTEFVHIFNDPIDDGGETVRVKISDAELCDDASKTITISRGEATGTITNSDPIPAAWLARFGRTVADQVIDAVEGRMGAARAPGTEASLAGQRVGASGAPEDFEARVAEGGLDTLADWLRGADEETGTAALTSRTASGRELLSGSSFALTAGSAESGFGALWGRGALSRFDGREGDLTLDGEVASALLGADFTRGRGTAGLVVAHSLGEGGYRSPNGGGEVETTLTGLYPWGRYAASERLSLWGVAGYGAGTLTLTPEGQAPIETDMNLIMAAVGGRGVVAEAPAEGGLELSVTSDALVVRTTSEEVRGSGGSLGASEADVTRLRLGLEGTWRGLGTLVPTLEVGARHDGGDAETGFGADIGARLLWADPSLGMRAELAARGLLTHEDGSLSERGFAGSLAWDPSPDTDRGPKLTLRQAVGAEATGGMDALLRPDTAHTLAAANDDGPDRRRLEARLGYGIALFGGSWTGLPEVGFGLTEASREYIHAWRLLEARDAGLVFGLDVEGVRNEKLDGDAAPEHRVGLGLGWELVGARHEDLELRLEASRLLPANDNPENRIGVRLTARW